MPHPIPPPRVEGHTTTTDVPLYCCAYGPVGGARALVLHGGPGASHDYLLPQMLRLAEARELVFYDQRGGGRSRTDSAEPITWRTHVDDLGKVIDELGFRNPTIIGYSWGGLLALLHAIEATERPELGQASRLVLIDPAPVTRAYRTRFEAEFSRRLADAPVQAMREELVGSGLKERDPAGYRQRAFEISVAPYFADARAASELTPFRLVARVQQSVWDSLDDYDLRPRLEQVHVDALVLHGDRDPIPVDSSSEIARAIHARFIVLSGSGHAPYVEQADALFNSIEQFLRETSAAARNDT
jgi:proline iminopeptidase